MRVKITFFSSTKRVIKERWGEKKITHQTGNENILQVRVRAAFTTELSNTPPQTLSRAARFTTILGEKLIWHLRAKRHSLWRGNCYAKVSWLVSQREADFMNGLCSTSWMGVICSYWENLHYGDTFMGVFSRQKFGRKSYKSKKNSN